MNESQTLPLIPSSWTDAAVFFADLHRQPVIAKANWAVIIDWLLNTEFDDRSYLAGEVAAALVRDRASTDVQQELRVRLCRDDWQRHFREIIANTESTAERHLTNHAPALACRTDEELETRMKQIILSRTSGRIHGLRVQVRNGRVVLSGRTSTYYNKRLATDAAMEASVIGVSTTEIDRDEVKPMEVPVAVRNEIKVL